MPQPAHRKARTKPRAPNLHIETPRAENHIPRPRTGIHVLKRIRHSPSTPHPRAESQANCCAPHLALKSHAELCAPDPLPQNLHIETPHTENHIPRPRTGIRVLKRIRHNPSTPRPARANPHTRIRTSESACRRRAAKEPQISANKFLQKRKTRKQIRVF